MAPGVLKITTVNLAVLIIVSVMIIKDADSNTSSTSNRQLPGHLATLGYMKLMFEPCVRIKIFEPEYRTLICANSHTRKVFQLLIFINTFIEPCTKHIV